MQRPCHGGRRQDAHGQPCTCGRPAGRSPTRCAMPEYNAPLRDMRFLLNDVFDAPALWQRLP
ncbi:acyl-CoA dehydrogenase N-terminal domain-containing protein, partial [Pseudomonas aeruginosa]|nr:acyl-CoA dehydrogenase N-terminal domain-containing protein [Pseudomonas aeruginosa]